MEPYESDAERDFADMIADRNAQEVSRSQNLDLRSAYATCGEDFVFVVSLSAFNVVGFGCRRLQRLVHSRIQETLYRKEREIWQAQGS